MSVIDETAAAWGFVAVGLMSSFLIATLIAAVVAVGAFARRGFSRYRFLAEVIKGGLLASAIGFLAWVVGYMTGASRVPAASDVVPAVLGSVGALAGVATLRYGHSIQMAIILVAFAFSLFVGTSLGAKIREQHEIMDTEWPSVDFMEREARKENEIKKYREGLGLSWPPDRANPTSK